VLSVILQHTASEPLWYLQTFLTHIYLYFAFTFWIPYYDVPCDFCIKHLCSVRLSLQLCVGGLMSYLCCCVPYDASFTGLSICDCPFCILSRLFNSFKRPYLIGEKVCRLKLELQLDQTIKQQPCNNAHLGNYFLSQQYNQVKTHKIAKNVYIYCIK
jgi:hypothetical protein